MAVSAALAQGLPAGREVPAIFPPPRPAAPQSQPVPETQYICPVGYQKPDPLSAPPILKVCLPVGPPVGTRIGANSALATQTATSRLGGGVAPAVTSVPVLVCGRRPNVYACGRNAAECCPMTMDNPCYGGAYACKLDASQSGVNTACCIR
jgi:hypothetical protein